MDGEGKQRQRDRNKDRDRETESEIERQIEIERETHLRQTEGNGRLDIEVAVFHSQKIFRIIVNGLRVNSSCRYAGLPTPDCGSGS